MAQIRDSVWSQRALFTFDAHVDELVAFFRTVIESVPNRRRGFDASRAAQQANGRHDSPNGANGKRPTRSCFFELTRSDGSRESTIRRSAAV